MKKKGSKKQVKNKEPGQRGRKEKYFTHVEPYLQQIKWWTRDGLVEAEVCKRLGVAVSTFNLYKNQYPELLEALKEGKQVADYHVEDALYKRATGIDYIETTRERWYNEKTQQWETVVTKQVAKFIPPDTGAAMAWLKNRQPERWKDKQNIELEGNVEYTIDLPDFLKE